MSRSRTARAVALLLALVLVATSCGNRSSSDGEKSSGGGGGGDKGSSTIDTADCPDNGTDGIDEENKTITLASSFPQSDPLLKAFSQISKGWKAYFESVNASGGVKIAGTSYKIKVVDKDDDYDETKTAENINSMLGEDGSGAFAVFNVVGTDNNLNIRKDLGDLCVPNVFAATGSTFWGDPNYPWTIGSTLAPYTLETKAFADYLAKEKPNAKVAILRQSDSFGDAYEQGFKNAIKGTKIKVTEVKSYKAGTTDVDAQVTALKASGADTFFNGATLLACPNALKAAKTQGWDATTFVSGTCISKTLMGIAGENADKVFATTNVKDPLNPGFDSDPAMKEYLAVLKEHAEDDVEADNGIVAYGYTQGIILVKVLEGLKELTRPALMDAMHSIDDMKGVGLLLDGVAVNTSADDPFLAENLQLIQYDAAKKYFNDVGTVIDFEGKTKELTPEKLITG